MRPIRSLLIYLAAIALGGALLAPCLAWLAQWAASQSPALSHLAGSPFHRFLARALLGVALIGLVPLLRNCGMLQWRALGLRNQRRPAPDILAGFLLGFASLAGVVVIALLAGGRLLGHPQSAAHLARGLFNAAVTAAIVAVIEEILFRGALFGILRKAMPWPAALIISSAIYSAAHFIPNYDLAGPIHWYSGLALLREMFQGDPPLLPTFFTLFVAGACLALAYQRTGALYFSMGLHAGWIFWLFACKLLTQPAPVSNPLLWGTDKLIDGFAALILLALVFLIILKRYGSTPVRV
jgi:hypothetical protein